MPEASLAMIDAGFNIDGSRISEQAHADARRGMKVVKAQYQKWHVASLSEPGSLVVCRGEEIIAFCPRATDAAAIVMAMNRLRTEETP